MNKKLAATSLFLFLGIGISTLMLGVDFLIIADFEPSAEFIFITSFVSFSVQLVLFYMFCTGARFRQAWGILSVSILVALVLYVIFGRQVHWLVSSAMPFALALVAAFKLGAKPLVLAVFWMILSVVYYQIVFVVRLGIGVQSSWAIYSSKEMVALIDVVTIGFILKYIGGELVYEKISKYAKQLSRFFIRILRRERIGSDIKKNRRVFQINPAFLQELRPWWKTQPWRKERFYIDILKMLLQFFTLFVVLLLCALAGVLFEGIIILASFITTSQLITKKWWHANSFLACFTITIFVFYHLAQGVISASISWFASILYGVGTAYAFYRLKIFMDEYKKNKKYREIVENANKFRLEAGCDYEKMKEIAKLKELDPLDIELLNYRYCKGLKGAKLHYHFSNMGVGKTVDNRVREARRKFEAPL